ncbi:MAG: sugar ABC transporter permease [Lachnospiraceae bacterium]|nr:sugar ABC transporter permease [Lachnospiraceae bacterium]MBQ8233923.1 sugar ABC transporter permease [Lachnospiraceae bacterium]
MKTEKLQKIRQRIWRDRRLYMFLLLPLLNLIIFDYIPMGGLIIAFKDYSARKGIWGSPWVGLDNFIKFFNSYECWRLIRNTLVLSVYTIVATFPIPIIFALMINSIRNERFKKLTQTIVNLPHFISTTVLVGILMNVLNSRSGFYGILGELITGEYPPDLFGSPQAFRHLYVWSGVWQGFGWGSIIYTAALSSVDPELHEAAQIDGASRLQRIIHVDLPCIAPTIIIRLIMRLGDVMSVGFEKVYLMQNSLNLEASRIISTYVYSVGLASSGHSDLSYATAIGMFNSVINLILIVSVNKIARRVSETSLW